jgi:MYXO-CTERM domain-containing protein
MKRWASVGAIVLGMLAFVPAGQATVLFDFESGAQGWGSYGPLHTDAGPLTAGSVGKGRFHTADFSITPGWGIVDVSPVVDLSAYTGMSVDARLRNVPGYPDFSGTPEMEFMIVVGYAEWTTKVTLTSSYQTFAVDFVDLTPNYYATIAPYFGGLPALNNPALKIQLVMRKGDKAGTAELDYDQVSGTPEPASLGLVALGLLAVLRRR